jgi:hypothetical protein
MPSAALPASRSRTDKLADAIRNWWDEQALERGEDPFVDGTLFDVLIDVDSLTAVDVLLALEPIAGTSLPEWLIKPGGYADREQMVDDLLPKIESLLSKRATKH